MTTNQGPAPKATRREWIVVGSAPPERAGAASGISETGSELGGALGIAILGSIGVAIYRGNLADLPTAVPTDVAASARDTLGSAVAVAGQLPERLGATVLEAAREAFVQGMQLTSAMAAIIALGLAVLAVIMLRDVRSGPEPEAGADATPRESGDAGATRPEARGFGAAADA